MIKLYNILNNKNNQPILNVLDEFDIDNKNMSIEECVEILNDFFNMNYLNTEHAYIIGFNNTMDINGIYLVSKGTNNKCYFYQKNIATFLILSGSERFILFHNHPNGTLDVSQNDVASMYMIKNLATILEVEFIDSVIISKNGWRCINRETVYEYDKKNEF